MGRSRVIRSLLVGLSVLALVGAGTLAGVYLDRSRGAELDVSHLSVTGAQGLEGGTYASVWAGDVCLTGKGPA